MKEEKEKSEYETLLEKAEQGDAEAQFNLGKMYLLGQGVQQDYKEAVRWYCLAAEQGYAEAQNHLGVMHTTGRGVPRNYWKAYKWLSIANTLGNARANPARDVIAKKLSPQQLKEVEGEIKQWLKKFSQKKKK